MKYIVPVVCVFGVLLLTSGTVSTPKQPEYVTINQPIVPLVVDLHISEYPGSFLNMGGRLKYHVLINGRIVGMHDVDTQALLDIFNITPYNYLSCTTRNELCCKTFFFSLKCPNLMIKS